MDIARSAAEDRKEECERRMTELYIGLTETKKDIETEERMIEESHTRMDGYAELIAAQERYISELSLKIENFEDISDIVSENAMEYIRKAQSLHK